MSDGVAEECACGEAMLVDPNDPPSWSCTVCGEACCDLCESWIQPGLYGHQVCIYADGDTREKLRTRIAGLLTLMSAVRLKRVLELVEYLSPGEQRREEELARRRGAA